MSAAISIIAPLLLLMIGPVSADTGALPAPADIERITVEPHDGKLKDFFTPESLLQALPHLRRTEIGRTLAFGKVWLWQRGTIHLKNGSDVPWRSFANNLILFDTADGSVVYTEINGQSRSYRNGKIFTTIYTWQGPKEIVIDTHKNPFD